jgi:hypothetical protein
MTVPVRSRSPTQIQHALPAVAIETLPLFTNARKYAAPGSVCQARASGAPPPHGHPAFTFPSKEKAQRSFLLGPSVQKGGGDRNFERILIFPNPERPVLTKITNTAVLY